MFLSFLFCNFFFLNLRFTLRGHSAPADQIRMEEHGKRCLTYDSKGRDRSVRVWDVTKGKFIKKKYATNEISYFSF